MAVQRQPKRYTGDTQWQGNASRWQLPCLLLLCPGLWRLRRPVRNSARASYRPSPARFRRDCNGPSRWQRGRQRVGHWFDGDGAILAVQVRGGRATALYRYGQTAGYQAEERAGCYLFSGYGMRARWPGQAPKNVVNTAVLALPDKLLALWEASPPHKLDPEIPITQGPDSLRIP